MQRFYGRIPIILVRLNSTKIKPNFEMNAAYLRHVEGDDNFHATLRYVNEDMGIDKHFNFCRRISENCGAFLNRVEANVEKVIEKKKKNKTKKGKDVTDLQNTVCVKNFRLLCNDTPVDPEFSCAEIFSTPASYILEIGNVKLPISVNVPWVESISLPKSLMAGFLAYPSKFESFFTSKEKSSFVWYRGNTVNGPWNECSSGEFYETQTADIGKFLRLVCEPSDDNGQKGPIVEAISPQPLDAGPGTLPCEARHKFTTRKLDGDGIRVVSYNILADLYVDQEYSRTVLFGYCAQYALDLSYRKQLLTKEILGYNADIMCLQEVDTKVFRHDLEPLLSRKGMAGIFSQKGTTVNEGTAIFYDKTKFQCIDSRSVLLSENLVNNPLFSSLWEKVKNNEALKTRIVDRTTTAQFVLLENLKKPDHMVLVTNVHLYFHPDADHIRLLQAVICTMYAEACLKEFKEKYPQKEIALLWCGDFNTVPECGIYQLVTTGSVPDDHIDWSSNKDETVTGVSYSHPLSMASACGTPEYTNYTVGFKACIDFIFYDKEHFLVEQVVPFPSEDELSEHLAIPSILFPSDHIALVADLKWKSI